MQLIIIDIVALLDCEVPDEVENGECRVTMNERRRQST